MASNPGRYVIPALAALLIVIVGVNGEPEGNVVHLTLPQYGECRGRLENFQGKEYVAFYGLPYAKPPVGDLRFKAPEPFQGPWPGTRDCSEPSRMVMCPQLDSKDSLSVLPVLGTEDCLYLNVFTPKLPSTGEEPGSPLPVMVWIHGGGFSFAFASPTFYGPQYFMETGNVVLVSINYRIGLLGFLSLEDDVISGNMGLKDQNMALKWVRDNIRQFHGDPDKVTIFGNSAGGTSVLAHLLSPWSKGLFHAAIVQSGSWINAASLFLSKNPASYAMDVVQDLGCDTDSSEQIVQCLRSKSVSDITSRANFYEQSLLTKFPWIPIVDSHSTNPFLPAHPKDLLENGRINVVPIMMGNTLDEGALYMPQFINDPDKIKEFNRDFDTIGPLMLFGIDLDDVSAIDTSTAHVILRQYMSGETSTNLTMNSLRKIQQMFTDIRQLSPTLQQIKLLRSILGQQPLYYYTLRHKSKLSSTRLVDLDPALDLDLGVCHGDDRFYLFHQDSLEHLKSAEDISMAREMVRMWSNFASLKTPDEKWLPVSKNPEDAPRYAVLDLPAVIMDYEPDFDKRMTFLEMMVDLKDHYGNLDPAQHPAMKQRMMDQLEEEQEEAAEVEEAARRRQSGEL